MRDNQVTPHNIDAEEAVLGSLLLDGELINSLMLEPFDFYHEVNAMIFKAIPIRVFHFFCLSLLSFQEMK